MRLVDRYWQVMAVLGALVGYLFLGGFLYLVGLQLYGWFRAGEWTHLSLAEALHTELVRCCVREGDSGRLAGLAHWLEVPSDWSGLHRVFEAVPASLALFTISVIGNCVFIYYRDRIDQHARE